MKAKSEKIATGCLIRKVLTNRSVNKEGLKIALHKLGKTSKKSK